MLVLDSVGARLSGWPWGALGSWFAGFAGFSRFTRESVRALGSPFALGRLWAWLARRSLWPLWSLWALWSRFSGRSLWAWWAGGRPGGGMFYGLLLGGGCEVEVGDAGGRPDGVLPGRLAVDGETNGLAGVRSSYREDIGAVCGYLGVGYDLAVAERTDCGALGGHVSIDQGDAHVPVEPWFLRACGLEGWVPGEKEDCKEWEQ